MRYVFMLSTLFLMSCASFKKTTDGVEGLASGQWTLQSISNVELEPTPKPVTLVFSDSGTVGGNAGCNSYGGQYTVGGGTLDFGPMMATKMACTPGMKTENEFFRVLDRTNQFEIKKNILILKEDDSVLAAFSRLKNK